MLEKELLSTQGLPSTPPVTKPAFLPSSAGASVWVWTLCSATQICFLFVSLCFAGLFLTICPFYVIGICENLVWCCILMAVPICHCIVCVNDFSKNHLRDGCTLSHKVTVFVSVVFNKVEMKWRHTLAWKLSKMHKHFQLHASFECSVNIYTSDVILCFRF